MMVDGARSPGLRNVSPLFGLRRRSVGGVEVTAQSVAVTAPSAAMASMPMLVAASAGNGTMYSYLIATVVILLVGYCISQFARRMAAAGSLYSFTAKGLGPTAAIVSGVGLALGYALLSMSTLLLAAFYFLRFAHRAALVVPTAVVVVISLGGVAAFCMIRGISVSSRVVLVVESVSIAGILVVLAVLVVRHGVHLDTRLLRASGSSAHGIGLGVALAITSFVGFESSAALGAEARRPHQSVPRAVMRTALGAGVLYLVSAYTQLDGFSGSAGGLAAHTTPLTDLADLAGTPWLSLVLDLGIAASGFACATGSATALTRLLFSMAREHVTAPCLARTHARFGTPHIATRFSMAAIVSVPVILLLTGTSPWDGFLYLVTISTFGYMVAYILVCVALPRFLYRIGELTLVPLLAGPLAGTVLCYVFAAYVYPLSAATTYTLFRIFVALVATAVICHLWVASRAPDQHRRIGVYDETTADDLFDPAPANRKRAS
jgi:amino acid transporter